MIGSETYAYEKFIVGYILKKYDFFGICFEFEIWKTVYFLKSHVLRYYVDSKIG